MIGSYLICTIVHVLSIHGKKEWLFKMLNLLNSVACRDGLWFNNFIVIANNNGFARCLVCKLCIVFIMVFIVVYAKALAIGKRMYGQFSECTYKC